MGPSVRGPTLCEQARTSRVCWDFGVGRTLTWCYEMGPCVVSLCVSEQARIQLHAVHLFVFGTDTASGLRVSNRQALLTTFDYVTGARALEFRMA